MEFNFDQRLKSENIELNQSAVLRRPGPWDYGVVFSEQSVHTGQEFLVRIDTHNKRAQYSYSFVSVGCLSFWANLAIYTLSLQTGILSF